MIQSLLTRFLPRAKAKALRVGAPFVGGASVEAKVLKQFKAPKVIAFKFKRRKGYHRKKGHRQNLTKLEITAINA